MGLDVRVLRDDNTEVELGENIDYSDTDLRSIIEGDRHYQDDESFESYGYQKQEFKDDELVSVEEEDFEEEEDPYLEDMDEGFGDSSDEEE